MESTDFLVAQELGTYYSLEMSGAAGNKHLRKIRFAISCIRREGKFLNKMEDEVQNFESCRKH